MKFSAFLKSLVVFVFCFCLFFFISSKSLAQTKTTPAATSTANTNSEVPNNVHNWTQTVMLEVMSSLACQLTGIDPAVKNGQCLEFDQKTGKIGFLPAGNLEKGEIGGAVGGMSKMISALYTSPLHTSDYFQNLAKNFGISKKSYAQTTGIGFEGLSPLINVWTAFRNIVYLILVVIFVIIGLAIMLRIKIDPRTVMTVQNQIPKVIIGILLVTFSFAIAGFLVDMMWVSIYLIYGVVSGVSGTNISPLNPSTMLGKTAIDAAGQIHPLGIVGIAGDISAKGSDMIKELLGIAPSTSEILSPFTGNIKNLQDFLVWFNDLFKIFGVTPFDSSIPSWLIKAVSAGASIFVGWRWLGLVPPEGAGTSLGWLENLPVALPGMIATYISANFIIREVLPGLILYLIIFFALFIALFRLWFTLLMSYIYILLDVVLAPFWIIGGIIPGSSISFTGWLKDIAANLLAFPATIFMLLIGKVFMDSFGKTSSTGFVPPLIGDPGSSSLIGSLISFGILLMTPNIVNMLKQALKAPKTDMSIIGQTIRAGGGVFTGGLKTTASATTAYLLGDPFTKEKGGRGIIDTLRRKYFG